MTALSLSPDAQQIIDMAQQYAVDNHHSQLDTAHLFIIIIQETPDGRRWLDESGLKRNVEVFLSELREALDDWYLQGEDYPEPTPNYLHAMRSAQQLAQAAGVDAIAPGHILAAILQHDARLVAALRERNLSPAPLSASLATPLLDQLGRDLTRLAREGALGPVIGREKEVSQLVEGLLQHGKNSALLLGLPGVGKTAVVERLAQEIAAQNVPPRLQHARLVELSVPALVAGAAYRGEFEARLQALIAEVQRAGNVILVIDEFHTLMGTGRVRDGGIDAANILKPALARGELTCIGITTHDEYSRYVEQDAAFARRFHVITVSEPSPDDTLAILRGVIPRYEQHHNVVFDPSALEAVVRWAGQYLTARQFPDKAIDVIARAASRAEIQGLYAVSQDLIAEIIGEMTGAPVGQLDADIRRTLRHLEDELSRRVIGQREAVTALANALRLAYTGLRDERRPKGVFLFVGPSGVGKTHLARALAEVLFGAEKALVRIDMSEYGEKYTVSRLIGAAPGYIGHDEPGQLTQPLASGHIPSCSWMRLRKRTRKCSTCSCNCLTRGG